MSRADEIQRLAIEIHGAVQGVGFRPFVFRLAKEYELTGNIKNTGHGVHIEVQGNCDALALFCSALSSKKPSKATIHQMNCKSISLQRESLFAIEESALPSGKHLALLPDSAICAECVQEFHNPNDRRYRYPFLHCMSCGPRFTLFEDMPFDRATTSMKDFTMCDACRREYDDPDNRRFFSQTNCCPLCGPQLHLRDHQGHITTRVASEAIASAKEALKLGRIIALKNTGGFLLLTSALNDEGVQRLRDRKKRPQKPFALLMKDLEMTSLYAFLSEASIQSLTSPEAPIVLLKKRGEASFLAPSVASQSPYLGIMLPHNALLMMLTEVNFPLVATSGNISDSPICIDEVDACTKLCGIADLFLTHNRRITNRLDDSIVHIIDERPVVLRRARGYIPSVWTPPKSLSCDEKIFASGAQLKSTFAFGKEGRVFLSQHIGNLDAQDTSLCYEEEIKKWEHLIDLSARYGGFDPHEGYFSTSYMEKKGLTSIPIQHHRAHVLSCMLDSGIYEPLIGIAWDGTGLGDDRTLWGGETFIFDGHALLRFATFTPFILPGGERAIKEPKRAAFGLLYSIFQDSLPAVFASWVSHHFALHEQQVMRTAMKKGINSFFCSSVGRIFDAVASLIDRCHINAFEGHAALQLEALCYQSQDTCGDYLFDMEKKDGIWMIDIQKILLGIAEDMTRSIPSSIIAKKFHHTLAKIIVVTAHKAQKKHVLLSGGVMQNRYLLEQTISMLRQEGFIPHIHRNIPPNDGGIAAGQVLGALLTLQGGHDVSCPSR